MVGEGVLTALSITKGVIGMFGKGRAKREVENTYSKQKKQLDEIYNLNVNILTDNFLNSSLVNYSNIAGAMADVTDKYIQGRNDALMNTKSYFTGGTSYNSNRSDTLNSLTLDYTNAITQYADLRDYNEQGLIKQFNNDLANLTSQYKLKNYQLENALSSTSRGGTQQILGSILDIGLNIFSGLEQAGSTSDDKGFFSGLGDLFKKDSGNEDRFTAIPESEWIGF